MNQKILLLLALLVTSIVCGCRFDGKSLSGDNPKRRLISNRAYSGSSLCQQYRLVRETAFFSGACQLPGNLDEVVSLERETSPYHASIVTSDDFTFSLLAFADGKMPRLAGVSAINYKDPESVEMLLECKVKAPTNAGNRVAEEKKDRVEYTCRASSEMKAIGNARYRITAISVSDSERGCENNLVAYRAKFFYPDCETVPADERGSGEPSVWAGDDLLPVIRP